MKIDLYMEVLLEEQRIGEEFKSDIDKFCQVLESGEWMCLPQSN